MNAYFKEGFEKTANVAGLLGLGAVAGLGALLGRSSSLKMEDIEDMTGQYLDKNQVDKVNAMLAKEKAKSFASSNPGVSGALSFGIAPAIANESIKTKVYHDLLREQDNLRAEVAKRDAEKAEAARQLREEERKQYLEDRTERMVDSGIGAAQNIAQMIANRR
jgi:hypothetical protein